MLEAPVGARVCVHLRDIQAMRDMSVRRMVRVVCPACATGPERALCVCCGGDDTPEMICSPSWEPDEQGHYGHDDPEHLVADVIPALN